MVRIAVAGGTGNVATELLRSPIRSGKHDIVIFTRSDPAKLTDGVSYKKVDYHDRASLTSALRGFDICLSFLLVHKDTNCEVQKNLIHASIAAGVRRFAPSEWGLKNHSGVPGYAGKDTIAAYLAELKGKGELGAMEYCLFQPSIFMDYFAHPYPLSKGLITWTFFVDFEERRALVLDGGEQPIVLTAISDDSEILTRALEDKQPWPVTGGIRGCKTSINELIRLGKKIRGGEWKIEHVRGEDIRKGELKTDWVPIMSHPGILDAEREQFSKRFVVVFLLGILNGAWDVSDEFNRRYPDYKFIGLEEYLRKAWEGRA
ncbi:NmrA-like family protein-like protein [Delitschia confertaspora ATCC 74209]|uniref:NmrA-like family protein-like protein n=1 Tax=Delitschia confertaspora ATCC 74209 TaxID=1513339 RepID=A0A9P4MR09_9PLEO|nr:NmrA-like family protein-like protein [Delitschia confertaspora ATCC 74209]